ncbi:hypothetical protein [Haloplanus aerogenes]|uniref:Uncharacterized protein n=1 Tax=Haloplanus aerogenes TaxID=660522 RepID=A0A3M0D0K0_9EURY|nr:hypothetical protein [Haloplanus aerogenes]AZH24077.1 hypothetical protein DU502_01220 [Haloplanus aerogenes]RMB13146.1 hypothetical protein ATH50_2477 [Haloplanus aerogenes]
MNGALVLTGLLLIAVGAAMMVFPLRVRSYVPPRQWRQDPERAERRQVRRARAIGGLIAVGFGCPALLAGLVL